MADLAPPVDAPQHKPGPRPLPLFLELVRRTAAQDAGLAARALDGLRAYQRAPREPGRVTRPVVLRTGSAALRDCGGEGRPLVLIPSLINPPTILDLDPDCSLARALTPSGRVLLLDWGPSADRPLSLSDHIRDLLVPLLAQLGEPAILVGYCLGGTMALAAAGELQARGVVTLASPWNFDAYPAEGRAALARLWQEAKPAAEAFGALPIEVLQAAFWSLDPDRLVAKFGRLAGVDPASPEARRFVALEDWANGGDPVPLSAAAELMGALFSDNRPPNGRWFALPRIPTVHFTAANDRIVPAATAPPGQQIAVPSGHVGMIVGRHARPRLHDPLKNWLGRL